MRSCLAAIVACQGGRPSGSPWPVLVRQGCGEAASSRRASPPMRSLLRSACAQLSALLLSLVLICVQTEQPSVDLAQLLTAWSSSELTCFLENFEPEHGNDGYATAAELAEELTRYAGDNDDGLAYDGPALCADALLSMLEHMYQQQRSAGVAHGVSRRTGQWRAPGPRQGEVLRLWRVVGAQAARRVSTKSKVELAQSELLLRASFSR